MLGTTHGTKAEGQAACESVGSNLGVPTNSYVADVIVSKITLPSESLFNVKLYLFTFQLRGVGWAWTGVTTEDHTVWSSDYHDWFANEPTGGNGNYPSQ